MNNRSVRILCFAWVAVATACAQGSSSPNSDRQDFDVGVSGDTTTYQLLRPAVERYRLALEQVSSVGVLEGPAGITFGQITDVAVLPDGRVVVHDHLARVLLLIGIDGAEVDTLARSGQGPGEFDRINGLAYLSDGRIVARVPERKFLVFDREGRFAEEWSVRTSYLDPAPMLGTRDGGLLVKINFQQQLFGPADIGFIHLDGSGEVTDTLGPFPTDRDDEVGRGYFQPSKLVVAHPSGAILVAVGSRMQLELVWPNHRVTRVAGDTLLIPLHREERREWEAVNRYLQSRWVGTGRVFPPVPDHKPAIRRILVGDHGRLWVQRSAMAEKRGRAGQPAGPGLPPRPSWEEPAVFSVFDVDPAGAVSYVGELNAGFDLSLRYVRGDTVWAVRSGTYGEEYLERLVLQDTSGLAR